MEGSVRRLPPDLAAVIAGSGLLLGLSVAGWIDPAEAVGFATGAVCVWLVAKGSIWNWPVGLANNLFFAFLFWRARLFGEVGLQAVYFILGVWGWWQWLHGGAGRSRLRVSRSPVFEWLLVGLFVGLATIGLRAWLVRIGGAAPFWDALTTALCLAAQYLLCRKRIGNWWLWITADVIYVPLYLSRGLPLISGLYAGFIGLCLLGLRNWRKELRDVKRG